jgi:hypothetical protein
VRNRLTFGWRDSRSMWKTFAHGVVVICAHSVVMFGQNTATMNGAISAGTINNVYKVDGVTNPTIQSIYSNPNFAGGEIDWFPNSGSTPSYLWDLFQNRTIPSSPSGPAVAVTTSCTGVDTHHYLQSISGYYIAVQQVEYDASGNVVWTPVAQAIETGAPNECYTVTPPTPMFGGLGSGNNAGYITLAQECSTSCATMTIQDIPGSTYAYTTHLVSPTIQYAATTSGKVENYYFTVGGSTPITYNYSSYLNPYLPSVGSTFASNFVPPNTNGGLQVVNTHIVLGGDNATAFTLMPFVLGQYDTLRGIGRQTTSLTLSQSAPNGIPWLAAQGNLVLGGGETIGNTRSIVLALLEGITSPKIVSLGPIFSFPAFTSAFRNELLYAPAPPYLPQNEMPSTLSSQGTLYLQGQRVTDNSGTPSVWQAAINGISPNPASELGTGIRTCTVGVTRTESTNMQWTCLLLGQVWVPSAFGYPLGTEFYDSTAQSGQNASTGGYLEVTGCPSAGGCAAPTGATSPSPYLCVGCSSTVNGYTYTNIGLTVVVNPSWKVFTISQQASPTHINGASPPTLDPNPGGGPYTAALHLVCLFE